MAALYRSGASAQAEQDQTESSGELLQMVPGVTSAHARKYLPAGSTMGHPYEAPPVTEATPDRLLVMMITFESAEMAATVLQGMLNTEIAAVIMERDSDAVTQESDPTALTDRSLFVSDDPEEHHPYASLTVMPMDDLVLLLNASGGSKAIRPTVDAIADWIADQPRSDTPIEVPNAGYAQGGVFEMLPDLEDTEILAGLEHAWDYDLLVSDMPIEPDTGTPVATPDHGH